MAIIEIESLRKEYRRFRGGRTIAVDGLNLEVPAGGVFGFLGPNGSGKTTTIRCLLGLIAPSGGTARLFGANSPRELAKVLPRVGSIVEAPAFFPTFSGRKNLLLLAHLYGLGDKKVDDVLERLGLTNSADRIVKHYSLGMRQRLAIAATLLKDPEILILDEPANGLDPAGIKEVRELIRALAREGHTVFVSSHQLNEVRQICDRVAILAHGRCVATGLVDDVLAGNAGGQWLVRVKRSAEGLLVLRAAGIDGELIDDAIHVHTAVDPEIVSRTLAAADHFVTELRREEADLETVFLKLTQDEEAVA